MRLMYADDLMCVDELMSVDGLVYFDEWKYVNQLMCICLIDIDECTETKHNCSVSGLCTNVNGSYRCECRHGFRGNGFECSGENPWSFQFFPFWFIFTEK